MAKSPPTQSIDLQRQISQLTRELAKTRKNLQIQTTTREHLEQSLQEMEHIFRTLVDNVDFGISLIDENFTVVQSGGSKTAYGTPTVNTIGKKCYNMYAEQQTICAQCPGKKAMDTGKVEAWEHTTTINGQDIILRKRAFPLMGKEAKFKGFIEVVEDITEARQAEVALQAAKETAEAANASKSQFLANMSHEIRTPLNGVIGVLNLLLSTKPDNEQISLIQTGKRSADNLLTVINDILDFSKAEAGELDLETIDFNLRDTLEEAIELPAMRAHEQGVAFTYNILHDVPSLLRGDPGRLRQVLLNLCNNALKFTKKGQVLVGVNLDHETEEKAVIRFAISDTGIGIAEDKLDIIFQAFKQTDASTTRIYGGTGLGLSICKRLTELMGGEIGVVSKLGQGSTFWAAIPFAKQPRAAEPFSQAPPDIKGKRFLLVDDNQTNLRILNSYIEAWGCSCDVAYSGKMALSLLNALAKVGAPFDAAIIDMLMPGMDGQELGQKIKSDPRLKDIPLIMLTSMGLRGDALKMKEIGFAAYLTKPVRRSQLFTCMINVLDNARTAQADTLQQHPMVTRYTITEEAKKHNRILIVEDNTINQKIAVQMIENFGFQATIAANGLEALRELESTRYDVVLMDVQMPEMDGFEATRCIRDVTSAVLNHKIPVIAMTAHAMEGDRQRCLNAGMDAYISKPVQPQELMDTILKFV